MMRETCHKKTCSRQRLLNSELSLENDWKWRVLMNGFHTRFVHRRIKAFLSPIETITTNVSMGRKIVDSTKRDE